MDAELQQRILAEARAEAKRRTYPEGFPALPEIPGGRYTSAAFRELERAHVWRASWLCVGREEDLPEVGSYVLFDKLGAPIILVRGRDRKVRAFFNTCRHRGAPVVSGRAGCARLLRCQYHSWAYDLDGRLLQAPDEYDFAALDKDARGLIPMACDTWGGWIFICEAPETSLAEAWGPLFREWECMGMDRMRITAQRSDIIRCNWKAAVDAFQEIYHINTLHPSSVGGLLNSSAAAIGLLPGGHSRLVAMLKTADQERPVTTGLSIPGLPELHRRNSVAYAGFPNLITPFGSAGLHFLLFWPRGVGECEMQTIGLGVDWGEGPTPDAWREAEAAFDHVLDEDIENMSKIQASLESGAFTGMMLGYRERKIYWMHEHIDARIGRERIPPGLAVPPRLGAYAETESRSAAQAGA